MQLEGPRGDTPAEEVTEDDAAASPLDRFLPTSLRTGRRRVSQRDERGDVTEAVNEPVEVPPQLREVGAHVELVLAAAQQAAERIRQAAQQAANEIRIEAGRDAARIHDETEEARQASERERSEVERYVVERRAEAGAQAEETLREANAEAASIKADAAREAGRIVADAERRGQELEDAARRRTEELAEEAVAVEARLDEWLTTLRTVTGELERRLAVDAPVEPDVAG
jgi:hypothetical protein